ncbi:hypothetical protein HMN09_01211300 [Mycena chlorophos]|uniref:Uncharacterized protein n=1 Tax=Mycena chlorophos TaxID=658473 RepID=A0A8H6S6Q0_MYCCL|nr:hypothetical protein HMN09_01211300 [Mycena chlorophos]
MIKFGAKPSYTNAYSFYQKIDALPSGPQWRCELMELTGDKTGADGKIMTEEVEFWHRDALECLEEIMGNPAFKDHMSYAPKHVYRDEDGKNREYSEMYSGDLWWGLQGKIDIGHTVIPVIIGSDETQLSSFSGDKKAHPVYVTVGNIDFDIRRKPSKHAAILLGYIPVSKLHIFSNSKRSGARHQLFHDCMRKLLSSLKEAGDGWKPLRSFARFRTKRGDPILSAPRDPEETLKVLQQQANGSKPAAFEELGLRRTDPFWKNLPHANIHTSFPPDLLHQLDKGVFKDHTVAWATAAFDLDSETQNEAEVDKRFQAMPSHPAMRHFGQGISLVSQWTGNEYGHMEKIFLGVINGIGNSDVILAVRAILDFIHYAHFEVHTDKSLQKLHDAWHTFHKHKHVFITLGIRKHFNIPKVHAMWHHVRLIQLFGSAGGTSTELSERLHIDCAKLGYRASNRKNYTAQMTRWLSRREAIWRFTAYLEWAIPTYDSTRGSAAGVLDPEDLDDEEELGAGGARPQEADVASSSTSEKNPPPFKIAKTAPFKVSVSDLEAKFGANDFLVHLRAFLDQEPQLEVPRNFDAIDAEFPVYNRITVFIPPVVQVSKTAIADPIRATCAVPALDLKKAVPAHFDTVLARREAPPKKPQKRLSLEGLFPGRVRAIFSLPIEYGEFRTPLAYVEWYQPQLTTTAAAPQSYRLLSLTGAATWFPKFSRTIAPGITSDNALDIVKDFYLNPYLRHIDFVLLRGVE